MGKKVKNISKELQDTLAASTSLAQEKISNIRTVRSFAMETREVEGYKEQMGKVLVKGQKEAMIQAKFYGVTGMAGNMIVLTVLYYGGSLVTTNVLTVGNLASFVLYSAYVGIGLSGVSTFYGEMMKGLGASTRLWELTDRMPLIPPAGGIIPANPVGRVSFEDVSFAYPSRPDQDILKSLSLDIPPKTVVAIVGPSGPLVLFCYVCTLQILVQCVWMAKTSEILTPPFFGPTLGQSAKNLSSSPPASETTSCMELQSLIKSPKKTWKEQQWRQMLITLSWRFRRVMTPLLVREGLC